RPTTPPPSAETVKQLPSDEPEADRRRSRRFLVGSLVFIIIAVVIVLLTNLPAPKTHSSPPGTQPATSDQCTRLFQQANDPQKPESEISALLIETATACGNVATWTATAKRYPGALGVTSASIVDPS